MEPALGAVFSEDEIYLREQGIPMHEDSIQGEKLSSSCEVSFKADEAIVRKGLVYDSSLFEKILLALIGEDDIDGVCNGIEGVDMSFQSARKDVLSHSEHFVGEIHQHDQSLSLPADVNMCRSNISYHQNQLMSLDERLLLELQSIGLLLDASPDLAEEEQEDVIEQDINENLEELCHDARGCEVTTRLTAGAPFLGYDSLQHGMRVQKDDWSKDVGLVVLSHRIIDCGTAPRRGGKRRSDRPPLYRRNITSRESVEGRAQLLPKSSDQIQETSKSKTKLIPLTVNRSGRKSSGRVAPQSERHSSMSMRNTCPEESAKKSESTPPPVESVNKLELASIAITIQHSLEELEMPNKTNTSMF